jgi:hypothetical protein
MKELSLMTGRGDDKEIDALYQLPLGEFTAARNALAKAAGQGAGRVIRTLEKPSVPAWAVNQLYWRDRRAWDKLIRAAERLRAGHAQALSGRTADIATLELQHKAAVKAAADSVRGVLARAGDPATPATMKAVVDTLQALPGGGPPGRLAMALAPLGFGALGALMKGRTTPRRLAEVVTFAPPRPKPDELAEQARRAKETAKKRLKELDAQASRVKKTLASARAAFDRAERARADLEDKLQASSAETARRRADVERAEREARAIEQERARLVT